MLLMLPTANKHNRQHNDYQYLAIHYSGGKDINISSK
jgi:hypothetical protein